MKVGYYTEVAGLGQSPSDVVINGKIEVYNRCLADGGTGNCVALVNFWRTLSNLTLHVNSAGQDGCRSSAELLGGLAGGLVRRVRVVGNLSLMDYCTAGRSTPAAASSRTPGASRSSTARSSSG
jgi:pyridoxal biosynthesis lyase PdxS